jgi:REP element-mobilizing transposase RayT
VVVMPNHLHGILLVGAHPADLVGTTHRQSLGKYMQWFKSITTHDYIEGVKHDQWPPFDNRLWQRNYYEHVIRNDRDLERIRLYIGANPSRWDSDDENPVRTRDTP